MKNLIFASVLGLSVLTPLSGVCEAAQDQVEAQDAAATSATEAATSYKDLRAEATTVYRAWLKNIRALRAAEAEGGAAVPEAAYDSPYGPFIERFQTEADKYAATDGAVPFLIWLGQNGGNVDPEVGKLAMLTLLEDHRASKALEPLTGMLESLGYIIGEEEAVKYIALLEKESTLPSLRGWATCLRAVKDLEAAELGSEAFIKAKAEIMAAMEVAGDASLTRSMDGKIGLIEKFGMGAVVPDIIGTDLDGVDFKLSDYKGKIVFVDFWGDW